MIQMNYGHFCRTEKSGTCRKDNTTLVCTCSNAVIASSRYGTQTKKTIDEQSDEPKRRIGRCLNINIFAAAGLSVALRLRRDNSIAPHTIE